MAQTAKGKDKANRGRSGGASRKKTTKPARQSRDTRSRSRAADERRAQRKSRSPEKARNPRTRRQDTGRPKNKRERAASLAARRDAR